MRGGEVNSVAARGHGRWCVAVWDHGSRAEPEHDADCVHSEMR
jgi:hypothetical protein